ncbi:transcriptional regulator [Altererythrobacter sp. B11]|uniref:LysR family transcriptional regulator n=1 Tax=Altererythrobacter sp. B11 TaxID=2060312 RepID=UPI000DC73FEC|nr:LysR family transcriptional regulator [Altererythrobacter sp. B11]BBC73376.1 transcriptional regulator [Altererythrobacter sp. B11]
MDTLLNMRAFLAVTESGSLSAAGRKLNVTTSVISKRIARLEDELGAPLLLRTTRNTEMTPFGERQHAKIAALVRQTDELVAAAQRTRKALDGHLRIKCPTSVASTYFGKLFFDFTRRHPGINMEVVLIDKTVNPVEQGFDLAIGALPPSYPDVTDIPLCEYPLMLCAAPSYIAKRGLPEHPSELSGHRCLTSPALGHLWSFESDAGPIAIQIQSQFSVNDPLIMRQAAMDGGGVALLTAFVAREAVRAGALIPLMPQFPPRSLWLKALVPTVKLHQPTIEAIIEDLLAHCKPVAPWDQMEPGL